jgi:hypothetical protein
MFDTNPALVFLGLVIIAWAGSQRLFKFSVEAMTGEGVLVPPLPHPSKVPKLVSE